MLAYGSAAALWAEGGGVAPQAGGTNRGASRTASTVVFDTSEGAGALSSGLLAPKEGDDHSTMLPSALRSVAAHPRPAW